MKVKIVKCSDNQWYTKRIGEIYEVDEECNPDYYSLTNGVLILKSDTIPVNEIRYELKSTVIYDTCVTSCEHKKNTMVGSVGCNKCEYNCGDDKVKQTVLCSWQVGDTVVIEGFKDVEKSYVKEGGKEMKRLDIRKDYEDSKISTSRYVSIANSKEYTRVQIGEDLHFRLNGDVTLNQANAILKVMGLNYELYEVDWSKVEDGAEVKVIANGDMVKLLNYIPDLKTLIVRCGDSVFTIDEDKVELV